jgi:hypothetical protein
MSLEQELGARSYSRCLIINDLVKFHAFAYILTKPLLAHPAPRNCRKRRGDVVAACEEIGSMRSLSNERSTYCHANSVTAVTRNPFGAFRIGGSDSSYGLERRLPALISVASYLLPILKRAVKTDVP